MRQPIGAELFGQADQGDRSVLAANTRIRVYARQTFDERDSWVAIGGLTNQQDIALPQRSVVADLEFADNPRQPVGPHRSQSVLGGSQSVAVFSVLQADASHPLPESLTFVARFARGSAVPNHQSQHEHEA